MSDNYAKICAVAIRALDELSLCRALTNAESLTLERLLRTEEREAAKPQGWGSYPAEGVVWVAHKA